MLMTQKEAAQSWCPHARVGVMPSAGGPAGVNDPTTDFRSNCLGSQCAMWRWMHSLHRQFINAENGNAYTEAEAGAKPGACEGWEFCPCETDPAGWVEPEATAVERRRGYCGLAGKPEYD